MNRYILTDLADNYAFAMVSAYQQDYDNHQKGYRDFLQKHTQQSQTISDRLQRSKACTLAKVYANRRNQGMMPLYHTIKKLIDKYGHAVESHCTIYDESNYLPMMCCRDNCDCEFGLCEIEPTIARKGNNRQLTYDNFTCYVDKQFPLIYGVAAHIFNNPNDKDKIYQYLVPYGYFPPDTKFSDQDLETFRYYGFKLSKHIIPEGRKLIE